MALWSATRFLEKRGISVRPMAGAPGKVSGMTLSWGPDQARMLRGAVATATVRDKVVRFFITDEYDHIQRHHSLGEFYEQEELDVIGRYFRAGTFVDIGTNVGNHALYAALFLGADHVLCFEPNPPVADILELNIALNKLDPKVTVHRVGLSDQPGLATMAVPRGNLGAGKVVKTADDGSIEIVRGDEILAKCSVDFIKLDTEGLEIEVLQGLQETITRCRPVLFVEVDNENEATFLKFFSDLSYRAAEKIRRYPINVNYMMVPEEK